MSTQHNDQALQTALERVARNQRRSTLATILATAVPVAVGLAFLLYTYIQVSDLDNRKTELSAQVKKLESKDDDLTKLIKKKEYDLAKLQKQVELLEPLAGQALGRKPDKIEGQSAAIAEAAHGAAMAKQIAGGDADFNRRSQITITQYAKNLKDEVDLDVVVRSLEKFGFNYVRKESELQGLNTNALWFGADVKENDVRLVALTLMGAGVDIQWISRFDKLADAKRSWIQIGGFAEVQKYPPWTIKQVSDTQNMREIGNPSKPGNVPNRE